jgi:uncharacterized protein
MKVAILSDTHTYIHPRVMDFIRTADEIWHAGDIGNAATAEAIARIKPLRAVYGNIDGQDIRMHYPRDLRFMAEGVGVLMTHIAGYPGRYDPRVRELIRIYRPGLVVCGHSHILKVIYDKNLEHLHINPGAAGKYGLHKSITAVRMIIDGSNMKDLEVLDIPRE